MHARGHVSFLNCNVLLRSPLKSVSHELRYKETAHGVVKSSRMDRVHVQRCSSADSTRMIIFAELSRANILMAPNVAIP